jgi:hypothetical protein
MMKNILTGKTTSIPAVLAALGTVAAMTMAPTSQALAYQKWSSSGSLTGKHTETFLGHGNTPAKAAADARNGAHCRYGEEAGKRSQASPVGMYNNTWWNVKLTLTCAPDLKGISLAK